VTVKVSNGGCAGTMTAGRILLPLATGAIVISPHDVGYRVWLRQAQKRGHDQQVGGYTLIRYEEEGIKRSSPLQWEDEDLSHPTRVASVCKHVDTWPLSYQVSIVLEARCDQDLEQLHSW